MFFRFGAALVLVVLISLAGTALEKRNLELKRVVSRQSYRLEILQEQHAAKPDRAFAELGDILLPGDVEVFRDRGYGHRLSLCQRLFPRKRKGVAPGT